MSYFHSKSYLLLSVFLFLHAGCTKKEKTKPVHPQEVNYSLITHSGTPGDFIQIKTDDRFKNDSVSVSISGHPVILYKINDTTAAFRIPVLSPGKVNIDLSKIGAKKTLSFTIGNYTPITRPDAVKKEFTDRIGTFLTWADTLKDQSMVPAMEGLKEVFLSEYDKLSEQEKLDVAYFLKKIHQDTGSIKRAVGNIARLADPAPLFMKDKKSFKDEFTDKALWFIATGGLAYGTIVTGITIFLLPSPALVDKVCAVALIIEGLTLVKPAFQSLKELVLLTWDQISFPNINELIFSSGRKSSDPLVQLYSRNYDIVFRRGKKLNIQAPAKYNSLSKKDFNQSAFFTTFFDVVSKIADAYDKIKTGVNKVRSWGSIFANQIPVLPDYENPIPAEPRSETRLTPADEITVEKISNPDITLSANANGTILTLTASGSNIQKATAFTFDMVYRDEVLGINNKMTVEAIYVLSGLNVNATASGDTAKAEAAGGVPPYTFKWSNGKKESILYKLKPGEYTVTVTDALDSTATASVKIVRDCKNSTLKVSVSQTDNTVTATANGGSPLYTYLWSNGATDRTISDLSPGTYTVTVTDANGCSSSTETTIEDKQPGDDDDDQDESDPEENPLFTDAAAVKAILSANNVDVSDTSWDSKKTEAVLLVLSKNGCSISNNRVTKLELKEKDLAVIPNAIGELTALTFLNLSGNRITSISDSIAKLKNLTALNLSGNQLTHIPEGIGNLKEIWLLDLSKNKLAHIPDSLCTLNKVSSLYLSDNELSELPQHIGLLTGLTSLHLHNNKITILPSSIGNLNQLTSFSLHQNKLTNLPSSFGSLTNLTYLSLQENQLTSLPPSIGNLTKLTALYLHQNQLSGLPKEIGNLKQLTTFTLYQNQLTAIPTEIGNLTQLTQLELHHNLLTTLPSTIGNLVNLQELQLSQNRLSVIPSTIGNLTKMTELSLTENQLTNLPSTIGNLIKLQHLYLHYNQLTSIPASVGGLSGLTKLTLDYNRLNCLPQAVWDLHVASAVTWFNGNRHTKDDGKSYGLCKYGDTDCSDKPCSEQ